MICTHHPVKISVSLLGRTLKALKVRYCDVTTWIPASLVSLEPEFPCWNNNRTFFPNYRRKERNLILPFWLYEDVFGL